MNKIFAGFLALLILAGCSAPPLRTNIVDAGGLTTYKQAYVEHQNPDEFNIYQALFAELNDMGIAVMDVPITNPKATDLNVRYSYEAGWDLARYLQSFQFQFINAQTGRVVATQSFYSNGIWKGVRDKRLASAFNELREKSGLPPSKQFPQ